MEKIDRLGWAAGVCTYAFGLRIGVRTNDPAILPRVEEALPPNGEAACSEIVDLLYSFRVGGQAKNVRSYTLLYFGLNRIARTMDVDLAVDSLESNLQLQVALHAQNRVIVHAGVVAWRGRAIVLPGYSRAGKSTLVMALLHLGATYYSDEYAVLDANGRVHPYARRLSLRQDGDLPPLRLRAESLGCDTGTEPLPIGLVVAAKYRPGASWRPKRLTQGQGVWELMDCTLSAEAQPEASLRVLERAAAGAVCLKGFRGEATETAKLLLKQVENADLCQERLLVA